MFLSVVNAMRFCSIARTSIEDLNVKFKCAKSWESLFCKTKTDSRITEISCLKQDSAINVSRAYSLIHTFNLTFKMFKYITETNQKRHFMMWQKMYSAVLSGQ